MVGYEGLKKIVLLCAEGVNAGEKIASGGGVFSALTLIDEVQALGSLEKGQLLVEAKDLIKEERLALIAIFKAKLSLDNKALENKIESGADLLDDVLDLGFEFLAAVNHGKSAIEKVKALIA